MSTKEIADGIITGVEEEGGKVIVVSCRAVEILEVPRAAYGWALLFKASGARFTLD